MHISMLSLLTWSMRQRHLRKGTPVKRQTILILLWMHLAMRKTTVSALRGRQPKRGPARSPLSSPAMITYVSHEGIRVRTFTVWAVIAASCFVAPIPASAAGCDGITLEQCRERISSIDRAIAWLEVKKQQNPSQTEAAFQSCKARVPDGSDISVVLNCMLDILGP